MRRVALLTRRAYGARRQWFSTSSTFARKEAPFATAAPLAPESPSDTQISEDNEVSKVQNHQFSDAASPGLTVYANPICSQLDQMLLKCDDFESVLTLLITHRGVFFVHNLVTAIQVLGVLAEDLADPIVINEMLRDARYDLLVRDLIRFIPKLDFTAMANIAYSLKQLDHKYYTLLTRMMRPLLNSPIPDVTTVLRCAQAYAWAGYHTQHRFYAHCAAAIADAAPHMEANHLVQACILFGGVTQYNARFFLVVEQTLIGRDLLRTLDPSQLADISTAFSIHLSTQHDAIFSCIADILEQNANEMHIAPIARILQAFRRVALRFDSAVIAALAACRAPLQRAWLLRRRVDGVKTADVSTLIETAAYFGIHTDLTPVALNYLDDFSDEVAERTAIHVVYAICATGASSTHSRLLKFLFRKIGAGTAWEKQKLRVFQLWICQLLQFPWLDARLPKRCLRVGLRAWVLHRRGYGSPFPDEVRSISRELEAMGVEHATFVPMPDTPYEIDIAIGSRKNALLVISETARNTLDPVGGVLLQLRHLRSHGWRPVVISRKVWLDLLDSTTEARRNYLRSLLGAFNTDLENRIGVPEIEHDGVDRYETASSSSTTSIANSML